MKKVILLLVLVLGLVNGVGAAPLNLAQVPVEAKWLAHVDFEALGGTDLWWLVSQEIPEQAQQKIDDIAEITGCDPTEDIYGLTLLGPDAEEENVVALFYGKYDQGKLESLLKGNAAYSESVYKGKTIYHWVEKVRGRNQCGIFAADSMIVVSQSEAAVQQMIDLLEGEGKSLAEGEGPLTGLVEAPEGVVLVASAQSLNELVANKPRAALAKKLETFTLKIGEYDGCYLDVQMDMVTQNEVDAERIAKSLMGLRAFIELKHGDSSEVSEMFDATSMKWDKNNISVHFRYPSVELFEMAKAHVMKKMLIRKGLTELNKLTAN